MPKHKYIQGRRHAAYGPPNVTSKYSPLEDIDFDETDEGYCDSLLARRWQVLNNLGLLPQQLNLFLPDWDKTSLSERGKKPPLVVISTNRSSWIKKALASATIKLEGLGIEEFDNASDLRALDLQVKQLNKERLAADPPLTPLPASTALPSPPMYSPKRIGAAAGPRNVYVLVHAAEYETYRTNLVDTEITVVGWEFRRPRRCAIPVCGFGASRFAAIEFCKQLREMSGEPWDYAWLFDDNVVAFTAFAGYVKVEEVMNKAKTAGKPYICAGFSGGSSTIAATQNQSTARKEVEAGKKAGSERGKQPAKLPPTKTPALVQQAALWNIAELATRKLNFGPIFVASGEDVSMGNYFDLKKIPYLHYVTINIVKEDTVTDGGPGAKAIQKGREAITELIAESEYLTVPTGPPPPIMFKQLPKKERDPTKDPAPYSDKEQTLMLFVTKTVLPYASLEIQLKAKNWATRNTAMCHAAEQTICKAIKQGRVGDPALDQIFKLNGTGDQEVLQISTDD